jgi:predicted outer membrane protein
MNHTRKSVLLGVGALLLATTATAQNRMQGSGIRISKDGGTVGTTPSTTEMTVTASELTYFFAPFDIAPYANLNEKNITALFAGGDSLEIQLGHLAHSKGTAAAVRDFGNMLVTDHTAHLAKNWEIITDEDVGVEAPPSNPEGDALRALLSWLQTNPASRTWDATFLRAQAQHHQNVIDILNQNLKNAHDDDLEDFIKKSLTSLAKHRDTAKSIGTTLGVTIQ